MSCAPGTSLASPGLAPVKFPLNPCCASVKGRHGQTFTIQFVFKHAACKGLSKQVGKKSEGAQEIQQLVTLGRGRGCLDQGVLAALPAFLMVNALSISFIG